MRFKNSRFKKRMVCFSKWTRKNYAIYNSLGKVVKICVLVDTLTIAATQAKCSTMIDSAEIADSVTVEEITVSSDRVTSNFSQLIVPVAIVKSDDFAAAPQQNLIDALEYTAQVDIRQRGLLGVQSDLSIRGGTTDQNAIILNKINITDPQTGHNNFTLPVDIDDVERVEIIVGQTGRASGVAALSGALCFFTPTDTTDRYKVTVLNGANGLYKIAATASVNNSKVNNFLAASVSHSDGYTDNTDFDIHNLFYRGVLAIGKSNINAQAGYTEKHFGSNGFYSLSYPDQYEENESWLASLGTDINFGPEISVNAYWRRLNDYYVLKRSNPAFYQNYHQTDAFGANLQASFVTNWGTTTFGLENRTEKIKSTRLGHVTGKQVEVKDRDSIFYDHFYDRNFTTVSANHKFVAQHFAVSAGGVVLIDGGVNFYPGIDATYMISNSLCAFASANAAFRQPTFTDLFYQSPKNVGNENLKSEEVTTYEVGFKADKRLFNARAAVYFKQGRNIIDWARLTGEELYVAQNVTEVNTFGQEFDVTVKPASIFKQKYLIISELKCGYSHIGIQKSTGDYESLYALDHLRHKLTASATLRSVGGFEANVRLVYQHRNGSYDVVNPETKQIDAQPYKGFATVDAGISHRGKYVTQFVEATNIGNAKSFDFSGLELPGRWIKIGVKVDLTVAD